MKNFLKMFFAKGAAPVNAALPPVPEDNEAPVPRSALREKLRLLGGYFTTPGKGQRILEVAGILGFVGAEIGFGAGVAVALQSTIDNIVTAVTTKAITPVIYSLFTAAGMAAGQTIAARMHEYKMSQLEIKWRKWLTEKFQNAWLANKNFFKIATRKDSNQHPDQRIAQDMGQVTETALSLGLGLFKSVLSVAVYTVLLLKASPLFVVAALGTAAITTVLTKKVGKSLDTKYSDVENKEAVLRSAFQDVAKNSQHIALADLENVEKKILTKAASSTFAAKVKAIKGERNLGFFTDYVWHISEFVPLALAVPVVVFKGATLGSIELVRRYYRELTDAANWTTQTFTMWAKFSAAADRVIDFSKAIEGATQCGPELAPAVTPAITPANNNIAPSNFLKVIFSSDAEKPGLQSANTLEIVKQNANEGFQLVDVKIGAPTGLSQTFTDIDFGSYTFYPGDRVMIEGDSGCGKTTALKIFKDPKLWDYGSSGQVIKPANAKEIFIPSSNYLPDVSLMEIICGSDDAGKHSRDDVAAALTKVGLDKLIPDLTDNNKKRDQWNTLSDGQKKRVNIASVLLRKPDIVSLDEITSALDPRAERKLYQLLIQELPNTIFLSIVHREGIRDMHNVFAKVENGKVTYTRVDQNKANLGREIPLNASTDTAITFKSA